MRGRWRGSAEGRVMIEPLLGLVVAVCLAAYLVVTLLKPERF
ncbi:K(+)-transporting ATPase subunit F [Ancylobacter sp. 6x-1]|uniref:K(+)-transporting ATPase subunit F n=1 Tax=Ancylobacter crimeensis TaxID=2579147 RepID=A0ABT0DCZ2_9HYPH|nr:K(+)-transporting ATPase subunit F [Ancylobacter crimeensis]MCK0197823.1 K(+)-transporting ATPase subunit F [Ancylobacter crimeensis]